MDVLDDSKGGFRERSVAVGKQAALQKQLQELQRSHQVNKEWFPWLSTAAETALSAPPTISTVLLSCAHPMTGPVHCMDCHPSDSSCGIMSPATAKQQSLAVPSV